MSEVKVPFGDSAADTAVLLLAAAEELGVEAAVVRVSDGDFYAPAEVANKAGVEYEADEVEKPKKAVAKKAASKE